MPELTAAEQMLRRDLNYASTNNGWQPREKTAPTDRKSSADRVREGMTAAEVRQLLGRASRTSRQILFRRYREQWWYDTPAGFWIELDCHLGQDSHVVVVHRAEATKP